MTDYPRDPRPRALVKAHVGKVAGGLAAAVALATPVVASFEGERTVGYADIIGVPTYCYGGTGPNAVIGKRYTHEECRTQLAQDVMSHAEPLLDCVAVEVPSKTFQAMISLSYNIGVGAECKSSIVRKLNAGDLQGACEAFLLYNKAGGRVINGLVKRRQQERALCLEGLSAPVEPTAPPIEQPKEKPSWISRFMSWLASHF